MFVRHPILAWLIPAILATPIQPNQCQAVDGIIVILKLDTQAPSFCSSFLHIQTSTIHRLSTSILTTTDATTTPISITTDIVPSPATVTTTVITGTQYTQAPVKAKRADLLLSEIEKFASKDISTACGCLSLPTPTIIVTSLTITTHDVTATAPTSLSTVLTTTPMVTTTTIYTVTEVPYPAGYPAACISPPGGGALNFDMLSFQDSQEFSEPDAESCCLRCWTTLNCAAWDYVGGPCYLSLTDGGYLGTVVGSSSQCPSGIAQELDYVPTDVLTGVTGPCAAPA